MTTVQDISAGLPALTGTADAVTLAEPIRRQRIAAMAEEFEACHDHLMSRHLAPAVRASALARWIERECPELRVASAAWWVDVGAL